MAGFVPLLSLCMAIYSINFEKEIRNHISMKNYLNFIILFILIGQVTLAQPKPQTYFCPPCGAGCDTITHYKAGTCEHCGMTLVARLRSEQMAMLNSREQNQEDRIRVAVYIHQGMEILDFAGPVEVFTSAGMQVYTVGLTKDPIISQGTVKIVPQYSLEDCPESDMLVVFGGNAIRASSEVKVQEWLKKHTEANKLTYSVCTGAFFLAKAGLLDGKVATTFHNAIENLRKIAPKAKILDDVKFVDSGNIISAAGVSSGIDGALYVVERLLGKERARRVATYMEYDHWKADQGFIVKDKE